MIDEDVRAAFMPEGPGGWDAHGGAWVCVIVSGDTARSFVSGIPFTFEDRGETHLRFLIPREEMERAVKAFNARGGVA